MVSRKMRAAFAVKLCYDIFYSVNIVFLCNTLFHVWSKLWLLNCILNSVVKQYIALLVNVMKAAKLVKDYCILLMFV